AFVKMGYEHPVALIYLLIFVEFVGGLAIAAGLFTRFFAAAVTIEMAVITFVHYWPNGFSWLNRGYEFTLMWGLVSLAILIRGGGSWCRWGAGWAGGGRIRATGASAPSFRGSRALSPPQPGGAGAPPQSFAALRLPGYRAYFVGSALAMMADSVEHVISYWII